MLAWSAFSYTLYRTLTDKNNTVVIVTEAHNRLGLTLSVDVTGSN